MQKPIPLKIYDDEVQKKYPNKRVGKHTSDNQINNAINEYIETGEKDLGVQLVRKLHWDQFHKNDVLGMVSEQVLRYKHYELMEEKEDFQKIFKVAQHVMAKKILNRLFFATYPENEKEKNSKQKKRLSYKQISTIVQALLT